MALIVGMALLLVVGIAIGLRLATRASTPVERGRGPDDDPEFLRRL